MAFYVTFTFVKKQITKFNVLNNPIAIQLIPEENPEGECSTLEKP